MSKLITMRNPKPYEPDQAPATSPAPTFVAGTTTLALPDSEGAARRITLYGNGHYTIDGQGRPRSLMVGPPDYSLHLDAGLQAAPLAKVIFPHLGSWDARYLGYENAWMLISNHPHETARNGQPCRLDGLAEQRAWLTLNRSLPGDLITTVTLVGPDKGACGDLLHAWVRDRCAEGWEGEDWTDHRLEQTPLWVKPGDGRLVGLHFEAGAEEPGGLSPRWVVRRAVPLPRMDPPVNRREFAAGEPSQVEDGVAWFVLSLSQSGPHWRGAVAEATQ